MYILKIETFSAKAVELLKELIFDKQCTEKHHNGINYVFEDEWQSEIKVKELLKYYKDLLEEFDDTEVYYYESDEDWQDAKTLDNYKEYGLKESDFIYR